MLYDTILVLLVQAEFLNHAVQAILEMYGDGKRGSSVESVMVVGHSLGGMVTRSAIMIIVLFPTLHSFTSDAGSNGGASETLLSPVCVG